MLHSFIILKPKIRLKKIEMIKTIESIESIKSIKSIKSIESKGCMSVLKVAKKEMINKLKFLKVTCFFMLLLASHNSLAQSPSQSESINTLQSELSEQVNINLADAETIAMVLDGVGLSKAEAIVDYRESNGDFKAIDDLVMVSGIGEVTVRNNVDKIILIND